MVNTENKEGCEPKSPWRRTELNQTDHCSLLDLMPLACYHSMNHMVTNKQCEQQGTENSKICSFWRGMSTDINH